MRPRNSQKSRGVREAGISPTRRSAARDGHRVWRELGASGLTSSCRRGDRYPLMTKIPGQRNPWAENSRAACASSSTSISASTGLRTHRLDRLQASVPTRLDDPILAERDGEDSERQLTVVGGDGARSGGENERAVDASR